MTVLLLVSQHWVWLRSVPLTPAPELCASAATTPETRMAAVQIATYLMDVSLAGTTKLPIRTKPDGIVKFHESLECELVVVKATD